MRIEHIGESKHLKMRVYILRTAAESRVKSIGVDAERKDQKIDALTKQVRLVLTCGDHR